MAGRALDYLDECTSAPADVVLRTPPNWPAVGFFGVLGGVHFAMAVHALYYGRAGYLSLAFGLIFLLASWVAYLVSIEIAVLPSERRIRIRAGYRSLHHERSVPFSQVKAVRVTTGSPPEYPVSRVDVVCRDEDIECPPTPVARQEALCLAVAIGVRLIKVSGEDAGATPGRSDRLGG